MPHRSRLLATVTFTLLVSAHAARAGLYSVEWIDQTGPTIRGLVDTSADTFRIDSWQPTVAGTNFRTPVSGQLPLTLSAFTLTGDRYDVPEVWDTNLGAALGWAFMLPVGQGVGGIQWVEGQPSSTFTNSSFGWGGFRNSLGQNFLRGGRETFAYLPSLTGATDGRAETLIVRPIPEPSTALFGVALSVCCAAGWRSRRRGKRSAPKNT